MAGDFLRFYDIFAGADGPVRPPKAPSASEEACCIPFPPGRRKLHIRSLLLPFQTGTISLGSGLADKWGLSPQATGGVFEPILFFLCQKEKNGFNLPRKERGPAPTVALNLTQKISDSSRPFHQPLPPERSLRSAHRLSVELPRKTGACRRTASPIIMHSFVQTAGQHGPA